MDTTLLQDGATAAKEFVKGVMAEELNTAIPGEVVEFHAESQTALVRCCIKQAIVLDDGSRKTRERCGLADVPVIFPYSTTTGFALTYPVEKGDQCLLLFSQAGLDNWQEYGSVQDPPGSSGARHFDFCDAVAIVGLIPKPNTIPRFQVEGIELRNKDRKVHYYLTNSNIDEKLETLTGDVYSRNIDGTLKKASESLQTASGVLHSKVVDGANGVVTEVVQGASGNVTETKTAAGEYSLNASVLASVSAPTISAVASRAYSLTAKQAAFTAEEAMSFAAASVAVTAQTYAVATPNYYVTAEGVHAASGYVALQEGTPFTGITKTGNGDTTLSFVHGICVRFGSVGA